jgi:hypothetical protein
LSSRLNVPIVFPGLLEQIGKPNYCSRVLRRGLLRLASLAMHDSPLADVVAVRKTL